MAHVVAVADIGDAEPGQLAEAFSQGHGVGESLERMGVVGQAVDDGDRRMLGELLDLRLVVRPDHQGRQEAREHECRVAVRLPACQLQLGGREEERHAAQLRDSDLERDPRPRRRLVEDQADRPPGENAQLGTPSALRFQLVREVEERLQLVARPVCDTREAPALEIVRYARQGADARAARARVASCRPSQMP